MTTSVTKPIADMSGELAPATPRYSLRALALRGSAWTIARYGAQQVLRLGSNLILTRLLFPEAFGLMALVAVFMQGLQMFSDVGIGPSIIQNKRGDEVGFCNTAWTIQVGRGFVLWLGACAVAWPVARFYGEPQLAQLLPVAGLAALISGFNATKEFTANRHLSLGRLTLVELTAQSAGVVTAVLLAWWFRSVWVLVVGGLATASMKVFLTHGALPGPTNRFAWDRSAVASLISFGKWIFLSTVFTFLGGQADKIMLGALLPMERLGIYSIAAMLVMTGETVISRLAAQVGYPIFSKLNSLSSSDFASRIAHHRLRILLTWTIFCALYVVFIDSMVLLLWDPRYGDAAWMTGILGFGLLPAGLYHLTANALTARGEPKFHALSQFVSFLTLVPALILGFWVAGERGAMVGAAFSRVPPYVLITLGSHRRDIGLIRQDATAGLLFAGALAVFLLMRYAAGMGVPEWLHT